MQISYDDAKRLKTIRERGLDFEDAPKVFAGVHFTDPDERRDYGEEREITVGLLHGQVIVMVWTERAGGRRIISMRKADKDERGEYYEYLGRPG